MGKNDSNTRLSEVLKDKAAQKYIRDYYTEKGKAGYPAVAMPRWKRGTHFPPVEVLIGIAKTLNTNLAYILGLTDIDYPNEYDEPVCRRTLEDLLEARNISEKELTERLNKNYKMVNLFKEKLPFDRVSSLIKLSLATDISVDYILGLTDWENWSLCAQAVKPFRNIDAGSGAYVIAKKDLHSITEIEAAIDRGDGMYCLLSADGKYVIFPNGNKLDVDDEMFKGSYVTRVIPEVK